MKKIFFYFFLLNYNLCFSQFTLITPGTNKANINASSSNNGVILPRMTNTQKLAISALVQGMMVFDTDSNCVSVYNGLNWSCLKGAAPAYITMSIPQLNQSQIDSLSSSIGSLAYNTTTKGLYISDGTRMNLSAIEELDSNEIQTITPTQWANGKKIPIFRLRHPYNVEHLSGSSSITRDFKILPYSAGMAIEYSGILENWVGQFSVRRGDNYYEWRKSGVKYHCQYKKGH